MAAIKWMKQHKLALILGVTTTLACIAVIVLAVKLSEATEDSAGEPNTTESPTSSTTGRYLAYPSFSEKT